MMKLYKTPEPQLEDSKPVSTGLIVKTTFISMIASAGLMLCMLADLAIMDKPTQPGEATNWEKPYVPDLAKQMQVRNAQIDDTAWQQLPIPYHFRKYEWE